MPAVCSSIRGCFWDLGATDDDVTGHSSSRMPNFEIVHPDDPNGGHLVRIRFEDSEEAQLFLAMLDRDRRAAVARSGTT